MPSYGEVAQLITALAALGACFLSWRNSHKIEKVYHATNSMKDELVAVTRSDARQSGIEEGRRMQSS